MSASRPAAPGTRPGLRALMARMGPSWLVGAIAAGPATMASVITAAIAFGFSLFWVVVLSAVAGAFAQFLAMRLGLQTEEGIVRTVERHLGSIWAWVVVLDVVLAAGLAQLVIMKTVAGVSHTIVPWLDARIWAAIWAVTLAVGLPSGGYRFAERAAKGLVVGVVLAFVASLLVIDWELEPALAILTPAFPSGRAGALVVAGVLGGAIHITLITMHGYTMRARRWTMRDYGLAKADILWSMLVAFGVYSAAIFLVAAAVLHGVKLPTGPPHIQASLALEPLVGPAAMWLFLLGLLGAAVSTLGGNTIVPPFLLADKLGWQTSVEDRRYRALLIGFALLSGFGGVLGGVFFDLLVLVIAFGLIATPFALLLVLVLLNAPRVAPLGVPVAANVAGAALILFTGAVAANHVLETVRDGIGGVLDALVALFALGNAMAFVALVLARPGLRTGRPQGTTGAE